MKHSPKNKKYMKKVAKVAAKTFQPASKPDPRLKMVTKAPKGYSPKYMP